MRSGSHRPSRHRRHARVPPLLTILALAVLVGDPVSGRELVHFDDFESGDGRFWTSANPEMPSNLCVPAAETVEVSDPTVLGNGTPGSVTRGQIQSALDTGGHIVFDLGPSPTTIELDQELVITRDVVIDGGNLVTLSGGGSTRVLRVVPPWNPNDAYTAALQNLSIADGQTPAAPPFEDSGGGILVPGGGAWQATTLVLVHCTFANNRAALLAQDSGGGAVYAVGLDRLLISDCTFEGNSGSNGGAIYSLGSREVLITDCSFENNTATGDDGNPGNGGNGGAIGIDGAERTVRICGTDVVSNSANAYGAGFFSVMYDDLSLTEFVGCTIEGNSNPTSDQFAGGAYIQGGPFSIRQSIFVGNQANGVGGLFIGPDATGDVTNCTFTQNIARQSLGGAITINSSRPVTVANCTIVDNHAPGDQAFAAGINVDSNHAVTLRNTVLADNTAGNVWNPWNIRRTVLDGGGNLQWPPTRPNGQDEPPATATVSWAPPELLAVGDYGGPTATMPPDDTSPAIGEGVTSGAPIVDQRGRFRTPPLDVGSYENP